MTAPEFFEAVSGSRVSNKYSAAKRVIQFEERHN